MSDLPKLTADPVTRLRARLPRYRRALADVLAVRAQTRRYAYQLVGDAQRMHRVKVDDFGRLTIRRVDPRTGEPPQA